MNLNFKFWTPLISCECNWNLFLNISYTYASILTKYTKQIEKIIKKFMKHTLVEYTYTHTCMHKYLSAFFIKFVLYLYIWSLHIQYKLVSFVQNETITKCKCVQQMKNSKIKVKIYLIHTYHKCNYLHF